MPTNLFGIGDNYDLNNSHVLPALIRKFHEAKENNAPFVTAWGTGTPKREFLYADDLADACLFLMENYNGRQLVNIGTGEDLSIKELTLLVAEMIGYEGEIRWDIEKPDGTPRKLMDVTQLRALGWSHQTSLREGIQLAYEDFQSKYAYTV